MMSLIEHCWVLIGEIDSLQHGWRFKRRRHTRGQDTVVEADWAWTLTREEKHGDIVGFWHTHVRSVGAKPSQRDIMTMRAWCKALGKPLLCVITSDDHRIAYVFEGESSDGRRADLARGRKLGEFLVR